MIRVGVERVNLNVGAICVPSRESFGGKYIAGGSSVALERNGIPVSPVVVRTAVVQTGTQLFAPRSDRTDNRMSFSGRDRSVDGV